MEILYIYLHDYKNLKKKAFNFSSEFIFETRVEGRDSIHIEINVNQDYIPNFFDNVRIANINAIIGQNGTGKSNILEFIKTGFPEGMGGFKEECVVVTKKRIFQTSAFEYAIFSTEKLTLHYKDNTGLFYRSAPGKRAKDGPFITNYSLLNNHNTTFIYYSNIVDLKIPSTLTRSKIASEEEPTSASSFRNISTMALFAEDQVNFSNDLRTNVDKMDAYKGSEFYRNYEFVISEYKDIVDFHLPENIFISLLNEDERSLQEKFEYKWIFEAIEKFNPDFDKDKILPNPLFFNRFLRSVYFNLLRRDITYNNINFNEKFVTESSGKSFEEFFRNILANMINGIPSALTSDSVREKGEFVLQFIDFVFEYLIKNGNNLLTYEEDILILPVEFGGMFSMAKFIDLYIRAKTITDFLIIKWRSLSSGEQSFLTLISRFLKVSRDLDKKSDSLIILFDEADIYFHPEWQRKLLTQLITFIPKLFQHNSIQLILTSNTPYLVSDLPPSNVILLKKKGSVLEIYNASSLNKKTFASNIHTLLSEDFFVSNLVGDFAKGKIEALIKYITNPLENPNFTEDSAQKMIKYIGEPIIRNRLQDMFDQKFKRGQNTLLEERNKLKREMEKIDRLLKEGESND